LVTAYGYVLEAKLDWRSPRREVEAAPADKDLVIDGLSWKRWTPNVVARLQAEGKPVLVNFTADWCLTCHAVVEPAIESAEVQARVNELGAVLVHADYTDTPEVLTRELQKFGRAAVPLVLVYPGKPGAAPMIIPDSIVTTVYRGNLLEALAKLRPAA
jgi:thiol:disulfide interchange protein